MTIEPRLDRIETAGEVPAPVAIGLLARGRRDLATWVGLGTGAFLLLAAIVLGGSLPAYADIPAFLTVFAGTAAVTLVSFSFEDVRRLPGALATASMEGLSGHEDVARRLIQLSERAWRHGVLSLESCLPALHDDPLLVKGLSLAADNAPPELIERELRIELQAVLARHARIAAILRRAAEVAPAMGLIGTLIGLVRMLSNLDQPSTIGPAMATAVLATLYGAVLANMVFLPLAHKLERNTQHEAIAHNLSILAAASIARQENPRRTEVLLNGILPPASRLACFD